jgi:hypothetical protein
MLTEVLPDILELLLLSPMCPETMRHQIVDWRTVLDCLLVFTVCARAGEQYARKVATQVYLPLLKASKWIDGVKFWKGPTASDAQCSVLQCTFFIVQVSARSIGCNCS